MHILTTGRSSALEPGQRRNHFLAIATPETMADLKRKDGTLFEPANYGKPYATLTGYSPSAAWAWTVSGEETPGLLGYNDV